MASTFVSKSRRVRFELTLRIVDLNNVPLVSGTSSIKWHLPSSTAAEHRGSTKKCDIRDHRVQYDYKKQTAVRLTMAKDGLLHECPIHFEVLQEYSMSGRGERIKLGDIHLNLAEYADVSTDPASPVSGGPSDVDNEEGGITRRYLMQDSKINSTLKLGIKMRYIEGSRDYYAPPLRTAPVFGGIAGIISSSDPVSTIHGVGSHVNPDNPDDSPALGAAALPQGFNPSNKELGEMQDMYRRTLAAFWTSQPGELKADECIEDIFSGGDGWGKGGRPSTTQGQSSQPGSGASTPHVESVSREGSQHTGRSGEGMSRHGHGHKFSTSNGHRKSHRGDKILRKVPGELEEMDVRSDLRMWKVGESAAYS